MKKNYLLLTLSIFVLSMALSGCSTTKSNNRPSTAEKANTIGAKLDKLVSDYAKKSNFSIVIQTIYF